MFPNKKNMDFSLLQDLKLCSKRSGLYRNGIIKEEWENNDCQYKRTLESVVQKSLL
jgi:hypothetical protein